MACTLSNKCAKNLSKRTVLLQLIIKNVVTCFFGTQCSIHNTIDDTNPLTVEINLSGNHVQQEHLFRHSLFT